MMRLRGLALLALVFPGIARRSSRAEQSSTLAKDFEALLPNGFVRSAAKKAGDWRPFGPRRASGPKANRQGSPAMQARGGFDRDYRGYGDYRGYNDYRGYDHYGYSGGSPYRGPGTGDPRGDAALRREANGYPGRSPYRGPGTRDPRRDAALRRENREHLEYQDYRSGGAYSYRDDLADRHYRGNRDYHDPRAFRDYRGNPEYRDYRSDSNFQQNGVSREEVVAVLQEFVQSPYARNAFDNVNADGASYGRIEGMFESVQVVENMLKVKLKSGFEHKSTTLLDKLVRHLRDRLPQLEMLQHQKGNEVGTIIINGRR